MLFENITFKPERTSC